MNGKYQRKQEEDPQALRELGKKLGFTEAVSYTHLDVYKRQEHHNRVVAMRGKS